MGRISCFMTLDGMKCISLKASENRSLKLEFSEMAPMASFYGNCYLDFIMLTFHWIRQGEWPGEI